jgi:hypothetical protein
MSNSTYTTSFKEGDTAWNVVWHEERDLMRVEFHGLTTHRAGLENLMKSACEHDESQNTKIESIGMAHAIFIQDKAKTSEEKNADIQKREKNITELELAKLDLEIRGMTLD